MAQPEGGGVNAIGHTSDAEWDQEATQASVVALLKAAVALLQEIADNTAPAE